LVLVSCFILHAQTPSLDSLKTKLKEPLNDSIRCDILGKIIEQEGDDVWPVFNDKLLEVTEKNTKDHPLPQKKYFHKLLASALNNKGYAFKLTGNTETAIVCYQKALKIKQQLKDKEGTADILNSIGIIYDDLGDINKALEFYHKALKIYREINSNVGIASSLNNLGYIYELQGEAEKALESHKESLKISEAINDKSGMASSLHNIGLIYNNMNENEKALEYYYKSIKLSEEIKSNRALVATLCNVARIYAKHGEPDCKDKPAACTKQAMKNAIELSERAISIAAETNDLKGLSLGNDNMANIKLLQGKYSEALPYALKCMEIGEQLDFPENIRAAALVLKKIYEKQDKYKEALKMYELSVQMSDSINNRETRKASLKKQFQIEYEFQSAKDSIANAAKITEEKLRSEQEVTRQRTFTYSGIAGLCVMIIVAALSFRAYRTKQKANVIISAQKQFVEEQKHIIEEKHKEITDSINYAERIQRSFLATEEMLKENLQEYFILFKPKDVVSGDFYWASKLRNGNFAFVTADSTGHGVPGAIMSLLNITSLERAIETFTDPAEILNDTRKTIIARLKKDGSAEGGKDGMDCSFISLNRITKTLYVSAANNPVWIARNKQLIEIKPDKMPVGKHDKDQQPFTLHAIQLEAGDMIYALTDGFPDQFGGPNGKKFMSKNLKELLINNSDLPLAEQKQKLIHTFDAWVGKNEQIDDVTIVGIRI
jgi:serine phosphatase RsbU (regulator of sigma subunit)/Tfp pilus assembly protein PilF